MVASLGVGTVAGHHAMPAALLFYFFPILVPHEEVLLSICHLSLPFFFHIFLYSKTIFSILLIFVFYMRVIFFFHMVRLTQSMTSYNL